jgi:Tol biopolymer transport system component
MMTYMSYRGGSQSLWARDLRTGGEWLLTGNTAVVHGPSVSPDGSQVAYTRLDGERRSVYVASLEYSSQYAPQQKICDDCGWMWGWTPDGKALIFDTKYDSWDGKYSMGLRSLSTRDLRTGPIDEDMVQPVISGNGAWIAFWVSDKPGTRRIFISHFEDGAGGPRIQPVEAWKALTPEGGSDSNPVWSPDGNVLYYVSTRDGWRCVWAQRLNPVTRGAEGPPWAVYHIHRASQALKQLELVTRIGLTLAGGKLIFAQAERSGSVHVTTYPRP